MLNAYIIALMAGAAGLAFGIGYIGGAQNKPRLGSAWADGLVLIAFGVAAFIIAVAGLAPR